MSRLTKRQREGLLKQAEAVYQQAHIEQGLRIAELNSQIEKARNDLLAIRLAVRQVADRMANGRPRDWCSRLRKIADGKLEGL